jgi:hypothetical protein
MTTKLPINLDNLLRQRQVEGERIEYKAGWNPDAILRTLCAFANDFENLGGGYVVIGQDCDAAGMPVLPPVGLQENQLDKIQQELLGFCNLIQPNKELDLTEGRSTGISKIIRAMAANGSPAPEFETDEERSYFLIRLPVHQKATDWAGLIPGTSSEKGSEKTSGDTAGKIVKGMRRTPAITIGELAMELGISTRAVEKQVSKLKDSGRIRREGSDRGGRWIISDGAEKNQQAPPQVKPHPHDTGSEKSSVKTAHVSDHVGQLLGALNGEVSRTDLMAALEIKHRAHFARSYLRPALDSGLVEMTQPDKPTSVLQRYRLTASGNRWVSRKNKT